MSYCVLARAWRPQTFDQVVGQEYILQTLANALSQGRLHHAYLLTGTRGVGKTTLARLLAKAFNCQQGITSTPCSTCENCKAIEQGCFPDLIEVDGASTTKVENIRELLDNVPYAPNQGRFKIYLIDEVHMLSNHSFNALLKTLEEPPEHVKFIFATTDPQKLPITIVSRCLQFNLKTISAEKISQHLAHILDHNKTPYEPTSLKPIAEAAQGSIRDALSLLDQAIAYSDGTLTETHVRHMLGLIDRQYIINIIQALAANQSEHVLEAISQADRDAPDYQQMVSALLSMLHQITLLQVVPDAVPTQTEHYPTLQQLAASCAPETIQLFYQIALMGQQDLPLAPTPKIGFEMLMLRMLAFQPIATSPTVPIANTPKQVHQSVTHTPADWEKIRHELALTGVAKAILDHCALEAATETHITLLLEQGQTPLLTTEIQQRITAALQQYFNQQITVDIKVATTYIDSPAQVRQQQHQEKQQTATDSIKKDHNVGRIINKFNAIIIPQSVKPIIHTEE